MKYIYPGDPEFTLENYSSLPFQYVISAYEHGLKERQSKLHADEAPISVLSSIVANSNRDSKKRREPYKMEDFFLYQPKDSRNLPSSVYGAAALELVRLEKLPPWSLFAFKALKEAASGSPPELVAYIGKDVMILAPNREDRDVLGMVIALESSYLKIRELESPCGQRIKVRVPKLIGKFCAEENVLMPLVD